MDSAYIKWFTVHYNTPPDSIFDGVSIVDILLAVRKTVGPDSPALEFFTAITEDEWKSAGSPRVTLNEIKKIIDERFYDLLNYQREHIYRLIDTAYSLGKEDSMDEETWPVRDYIDSSEPHSENTSGHSEGFSDHV